MKINKLFMGLAAMAFVACSSDDLSMIAPEQAVDDARLVELDPNFVIAGVGEEGSGTRTHWAQDPETKALQNVFLPIYNDEAAQNLLLSVDANLEAQTVGLCWLGQTPGTDVYTNYQFYHYGWLNKGAAKAEVECNELKNGSLYSDITVKREVEAKKEAKPADWGTAGLPAKSVKDDEDNLNYNSGVYKTDNKSIFGGDYIVYYPFNADFKDAGTIPAKAETTFGDVTAETSVPTDLTDPRLGNATFRYSDPVTIEGGDQAADFALHNLSSLVQLRVATPAGVDLSDKNIDQIVLYSAKEQLLKQANLAADKIVAGQKGEALYASTEGTKTITANFKTDGVSLKQTNGTGANKPTSAYITVLPTTVDDLVVLVHNATDKTWARIDKANTVFEAGKAKRLDIIVTADDFKSEFIAVDDASLRTALAEANTAAETATPTISVIGDITLANNLSITPTEYTNIAKITISGDDIIVPEDVTLTLNNNNTETNRMESDIRVLGKSCCSGETGGVLNIEGGMIGNVTMEPTEAKVTAATYDTYNPQLIYTGEATIAAGKTIDVQAGNVTVKKAVKHKGNIKIAEGATLTVNDGGDLNFMGSTVVNDGTIEVKKGGKYDMTDANGNATAADGQRMTNNGKFIHNVDAGVGTAVQSMNQNGEYRCKVDDQIKLDDAYLQWLACSVIEMVNTEAVKYNLATAKDVDYKHNGKYIDIEVNSEDATTFNNPDNGDNEVINIGNLTVTNGTFTIDYYNKHEVSATKTDYFYRTLNVNGDMVVKAETNIVASQKVAVTGNLSVENGATLTYKGTDSEDSHKKNVDGLAVTKDITVSGATFAAPGSTTNDVDALNITCANFYLKKVGENGGTAIFGNRTDGAAKNLVVSGTISNPKGCTFNIVAAGQNHAGSVLAWVTCKKLEVGGTFSAARPRVE